jgi:hypothetical protein
VLSCLGKGVRLPFDRVLIESPCQDGSNTVKRVSLCSSIVYDGAPAIQVCELRSTQGKWQCTPVLTILHKVGEKLKVSTKISQGYHASKEIDAAIESGEAPGVASEMASVPILLIGLLSCQNITTKPLPRTKSGVRLKSGTLPFDEYHTLVIKRAKSKVSTSSDLQTATERARPREHFRRGHFHSFKTQSGNVTHWINPTTVNEGIGARIHKSYYLEYE